MNFICPTILSWEVSPYHRPQAKLQGGNTAPPTNRKLDYRLLNMDLPTRARPSFPSHQEASTSLLSEGRQNENHNHRKLAKMITWMTALCSLMKLWAMQYRATQDRQVMMESSDKTWATGEGNGKVFPYSYLRIPWTVCKGKQTLKDDPPVW